MTQKWRRVFTFYSTFRRALSGGNLRVYGDAKVCGIWLGMHARWLGGAVIHYHTTPPHLSACVKSSFFSNVCRENQNMATAGNKKNFVWLDEEVELLLQVTLDYKARRVLGVLPGKINGYTDRIHRAVSNIFVYFPVLAHVCDVNASMTWADLSRVLRFASVHRNTAAERIQLCHSGGWFQIFAFLSPKNSFTM